MVRAYPAEQEDGDPDGGANDLEDDIAGNFEQSVRYEESWQILVKSKSLGLANDFPLSYQSMRYCILSQQA